MEVWLNDIAQWMADNSTPIAIVTVAVVIALVGERVRVSRRMLRKDERRRALNILRGMVMSKKDLDKLVMMRCEEAIEDTIQELIWEGRLNEDMAREYREMFADFGMTGLYPMKDIKRGIQIRLKFYQKLNHIGKGRPLSFINSLTKEGA